MPEGPGIFESLLLKFSLLVLYDLQGISQSVSTFWLAYELVERRVQQPAEIVVDLPLHHGRIVGGISFGR